MDRPAWLDAGNIGVGASDVTIEPWRATCIQTVSKLAMTAPDRDGAWSIIDGNVAHAVALIEAAIAATDPPRLVVLPEFAFQGPPHGLPAADWIAKACCAVPIGSQISQSVSDDASIT